MKFHLDAGCVFFQQFIQTPGCFCLVCKLLCKIRYVIVVTDTCFWNYISASEQLCFVCGGLVPCSRVHTWGESQKCGFHSPTQNACQIWRFPNPNPIQPRDITRCRQKQHVRYKIAWRWVKNQKRKHRGVCWKKKQWSFQTDVWYLEDTSLMCH